MDEPVFDITLKTKVRKLYPIPYTIFFIIALLCIPRTLAGGFVLYISFAYGEPSVQMIAAAVIFGIMIPAAIAAFGIRMWISGLCGRFLFYEEYFQYQGEKDERPFTAEYSKIERIRRQNGCYLLYLDPKKAVVTGGSGLYDPAAFESFIIKKTGKPIEM
ncbi:MAG: hypothetical protein NC120_11465 [Ruminococcus sp.]|nr:hypothetical protein [Ruminococcus sp.]